ECLDRLDRGRCALTLLLQTTTSASGLLYATASFGALELLASLPEGLSEPRMQEWAERYARTAFEQEQYDATTADGAEASSDAAGGPGAELPPLYRDRDGRLWKAQPLLEGRVLAGLLVMPVDGAETVLPSELCTEIAGQLLEHGDVTGWRAT